MATYYRKNDIVIAVDPGYDGTKVTINGILFKIPNNVIDITGHVGEYLTLGPNKAKGYLVSHYIKEKQYLIGELARKSILEKKVREDEQIKFQMMDSYQRFQTMDFEVNLMSIIGFALIQYSILSMQKKWVPELTIEKDDNSGMMSIPSLSKARIIVGVALPNDAVNSVKPDIMKFLIGNHDFNLETTDGVYNLKFNLEPGACMVASQVICALLGMATDDNGELPEGQEESEEDNILKHLPVIVIDGGYKTVGIFQLTQARKVAAAESNVDYAMGNIHKEVARRLKEDYGRDNIESFQIPSILEDGGIINYIKRDKEGNEIGTDRVDVKQLVDEEERKLCEGLINYLNKKFENLLDVRSILITGGTGSAYFKNIQQYIKEKKGHLANSIYLTDYKFQNKRIDPVFAIAVGMYKTLKKQIELAEKRAKTEQKKS